MKGEFCMTDFRSKLIESLNNKYKNEMLLQNMLDSIEEYITKLEDDLTEVLIVTDTIQFGENKITFENKELYFEEYDNCIYVYLKNLKYDSIHTLDRLEIKEDVHGSKSIRSAFSSHLLSLEAWMDRYLSEAFDSELYVLNNE
jgi:hypothetical protein